MNESVEYRGYTIKFHVYDAPDGRGWDWDSASVTKHLPAETTVTQYSRSPSAQDSYETAKEAHQAAIDYGKTVVDRLISEPPAPKRDEPAGESIM